MADKNYKLTFNMTDGSEKSVQFTAPQGDPGVHYGSDAPTDNSVMVWVNPDGESTSPFLTVTDVSESTASGGSNVVTFSDGKTLTVKNGKDGSAGRTPVKGADYFTSEDITGIVQQVISALGGQPVFGMIDANNNIILTAALEDGTYNIKYEFEDGSMVDIGTVVKGSEPDTYTINLLWTVGSGINGTTGNINGVLAGAMTDFMIIDPEAEYAMSCVGLNSNHKVFGRYYDEQGTYISGTTLSKTVEPTVLTFPDGTSMFRVHCEDANSSYDPSLFTTSITITTTKQSDIVAIPISMTAGITLDKTTGAESSNANYGASDFIAVDPTLYTYKAFSANITQWTLSVNCFNADKSQIAYLDKVMGNSSSSSTVEQDCAELDLPAGTAYIRFRIYHGGVSGTNLTSAMTRHSLLRYPR